MLGVHLLPDEDDPRHDDAVRRLHVATVWAVRERWGNGRPLPVPDAPRSVRGRETSAVANDGTGMSASIGYAMGQ